MVLVDFEIRELIEKQGLIKNAEIRQLGAISYDLTVRDIICQNEKGNNETVQSFSLKPNTSVIVSTVETLDMPNDLIGRVIEKNSQIRRGLMIAAPVYQPGHKTRIFIRVTNLTPDNIEISSGEQIASIMFEKLSSKPERPYEGAFVDEYEYKGLSSYKDVFSKSISEVNSKIEDIKNLENKVYGTVLTLMSVFVGMYSLISINLDMVTKLEFTKSSIFAFDLTVVGIIGLFVAFMGNILPIKRTVWSNIVCYAVPILLLFTTACII